MERGQERHASQGEHGQGSAVGRSVLLGFAHGVAHGTMPIAVAPCRARHWPADGLRRLNKLPAGAVYGSLSLLRHPLPSSMTEGCPQRSTARAHVVFPAPAP